MLLLVGACSNQGISFDDVDTSSHDVELGNNDFLISTMGGLGEGLSDGFWPSAAYNEASN